MDETQALHPTDQILDAFGLGKLDERASEAISQHLESCSTCRRRVAEVTADTFLDQIRGAKTASYPSTPSDSPVPESTSLETGPASPTSSTSGPPSHLLDYQVLQCLGDGGQGSAYLVRDPGLGRLVVLKRYHAKGVAVELEGQALARVRSPYTAQCYGLERQGDELFLVMEYIPGNNLSDVRKKRALGLDESMRLVEQVAEGLEAVHACGLVHRDVKPSNIVLGDDGVARLVDFGLAAHLGSEALRVISGSPAYMAPEQARGQWERIDARTDVYGLGSVLYHLLTGASPRDGKTPIELLEQARKDPIVPPRLKNPRAPRALERICLKAMSADPLSRYPSTEAFRRDLRHYRRMRRVSPVFGVAIVLLTLLALAWGFWPRSVRPTSDAQGGAIAVRGAAEPPSGSNPPPPANLRVTRFEIAHFGWSKDDKFDPGRSGLLGRKIFEARLKDQVTLSAKLSEPAYSYLIAFRPDGTDQLCDPDDEDLPPPRNHQPMYPPPTQSDDRYGLSEGTGLYVFALVVSRDPLPAYRDWKRRHGPIAWSAGLACEPGVVWRDEGDGLQALMADEPGHERGKGVKAGGSASSISKLASWLRGQPGVDLVTLEAFAVGQAAGP
jgi:serine/threonine protein kinase